MMEKIGIIDFLSSIRHLHTLEFASPFSFDFNLLSKLIDNDNFDADINLGTFFLSKCDQPDEFIIVDGLNRFISISLIIYFMFEANKSGAISSNIKNELLNENLFCNNKPKLLLNNPDFDIYTKIITAKPLSLTEKQSQLFSAAHMYWEQIKNNHLTITKLYKQLHNIKIMLVPVKKEDVCETFYLLNKDNRQLDTVGLLKSFFAYSNYPNYLEDIIHIFDFNNADVCNFLKDYLITKTNNTNFTYSDLFEYLKRYVETMVKYQSLNKTNEDILKAAVLYKRIIDIDFDDINLRNQFIKIKINNGSDAYPFLLELYGDFIDNNISLDTFIALLDTINNFLQDRKNSRLNYPLSNLSAELNKLISKHL